MLPSFLNLYSIHVELTDKCNAKCPVCVRRLRGGIINPIIKNTELGLNYFRDNLGEDFCSNVKFWNFCGTKGDPIACTELVEIIDYIKQCNPTAEFTIHTNGGIRSVDWWTRLGNLLKNSNSRVVWGIDGLEDTNHIYRRNVSWKKLWDNLCAYTDAGGKSIWQFLIFDHNKHQLEKIQKICDEKNIILDVKEPFGFSYNKNASGETKILPIRVYDDNGVYLYDILPKDVNTTEVVALHNDDLTCTSFIQYECEPTNINKGDFKVDCKIGTLTSDLYIDCDGALLPCCFIGAGLHSEGSNHQLEKQFTPREEFIPRYNKQYKEILNNTYYKTTLLQGITGDLPGEAAYTAKCVETCGKCIK